MTHEIKCHSKELRSLNWSNTDDRWVITAGADSTARIWDTKTGKLVVALEKHNDIVQSAIFTADDSRVVTVGTDKQLIVWEIVNDDDTNEYKARDVYKVDIKLYFDMAIS
jgi:WD40 repeat protein